MFKLTHGPETARTHLTLRNRLSVMLVNATKDPNYVDMELGDPMTHTPGIESHAGRSAKQVLARLRKFELDH